MNKQKLKVPIGVPILVLVIMSIMITSMQVKKSYAVPAAPVELTFTQADGTTFQAKRWGDEYLHTVETREGYSVAFNKSTRNWTYAIHNNTGYLVSSSYVVGKSSAPPNIQKYSRPTGMALQKAMQKRSARYSIQLSGRGQGRPSSTYRRTRSGKVVLPIGTANIPVILINFSDRSPTYSSQDFHNLIFGNNNGSMKDYYDEVSYGKFQISSGPGGVVGWYTALYSHSTYGENYPCDDCNDKYPATLVKEAVEASDNAGFNFAPYDRDGDCYVDTVMIVHQGEGEESSSDNNDIWSHQSDLQSAKDYSADGTGEYTTDDVCPAGGFIKVNNYSIQPEISDGNISTIGVFVHEYGHALGLPDLYDTDLIQPSHGIGPWGVMGGGSWNTVSRPGDTPAHMSAWSKYFLGWITPTQVTGLLPNEQIEQAATKADVYQFRSGSPSSKVGEYFLVENRQQNGFDAGLPGSGIAIWHIDEGKATISNQDNSRECYPPDNCALDHYRVSLEQADGQWELEKASVFWDPDDLYRSVSFDDNTTPSSKLYNGTASTISVRDISASGSTSTMTATLCFGNDSIINVNPTLHDFGKVKFGSSSSIQITLSNKGCADIQISSVSLTGTNASAFSIQSNSCPTNLASGANCTVNVVFSSTSPEGDKKANLVISSNASNNSNLQVSLEGYSEDPTPQLACKLPIAGTTLAPTIKSVQNGNWKSTSTWNLNRYPNNNDVVLINGHKVTNLPETVTIKNLCNHGELWSKTNSGLEIRAPRGIVNYSTGIIRGQDGVNDPTSSACNPGKDIVLKTAQNFNGYNKFGSGGIWWSTSENPGPIENYGKIIAGNGESGTCGGKGGDAIVLGRKVRNHDNGLIQAGHGGNASNGKGGDGGLTQVFGRLGGDGIVSASNLKSTGTIVGGKGGNGTYKGGRGGNLWLIGLPEVYLGPSAAYTSYCPQCSNINRIGHTAGTGGSPNGESGWVQVEPSVIKIASGATPEIKGGNVTIFGDDDFILDLSGSDTPVVEATGDIILAVGKNGVVDLRSNSGNVLKAAGEVKIFADEVKLDEGKDLSEVVQAEEVVVKPSKILRSVILTGLTQVTGEPGTSLPIRLTLANGGPKTDTFKLKASNSTGWSSEASIEVDGLDSIDFEFNITLPTSIGDQEIIVITATSQADPEVVSTLEVRAVVAIKDDDSDDDINTDGNDDTDTGGDGNTDTGGDGNTGTGGDGNTGTGGNGNTGTGGNDNTDAGDGGDTNTGGKAPKPVGDYTAHGIINDKLGNPVVGVIIQIGNSTVTTDENGNWEITDLLEGEYTVIASKEGYIFPTQAIELGNDEFNQTVALKPLSALEVMVAIDPRQPELGENVTYTSTVTNGGAQTATNVVLTHTLPEGTTLVSLTAESGDCNKDTLTCTLPDLATGETAKVQLIVGNTEENKRLEMSATLTSNEYPTDVQIKRTSITAYLSVEMACLPKTIMPQGELNCTATVQLSEHAASAATDVNLTVTLPQGVQVDSDTLDDRCVPNAPTTTFTCALGNLAVPGSGETSETVVKFTEKLLDPGLLLLTHQAQVTANEYPTDTDRARTKIYIPPEYQMDMALVVDVTNSMQEEMNGAKKGLIDFVNAVNARNAQFPLSVLIVFRDEVTVTAVTQDMDILIDAIGDMEASGGGMCPEASAEALEVAIRHVKSGGTIALVTDASPYEDADLVAITKALQDKAINFNPFLTGDCSDEESWNAIPNQP